MIANYIGGWNNYISSESEWLCKMLWNFLPNLGLICVPASEANLFIYQIIKMIENKLFFLGINATIPHTNNCNIEQTY